MECLEVFLNEYYKEGRNHMAITLKDLKKFFEEGVNGRQVKTTEIRDLSQEDKEELKTLLAAEAA